MLQIARSLGDSARLLVIATSLALVMAGTAVADGQSTPVQPAPGQKVQITQHVLDGFKKYQATIGSAEPGAFAVTVDGQHFYSLHCKTGGCKDNVNFSSKALAGCSQYGQPCYIFARENDIKVDYQVVP